MKLRWLFGILAVLLVVIGTGMLWLLRDRTLSVLWGVELLIGGTLVYLAYFYRKVVQPLDMVANGMDLLREQDFSSRLRPVGQAEADRIVQIFNRMMSQLKEERMRLREQNRFLDLLIDVSPMGVIIFDFDYRVTMINKAALRFLALSDDGALKGRTLDCCTEPLAGEILRIPQGETRTVRLGDAMIYRCSRLAFLDRGADHPFVLVESLTSEVVRAEKKAYEKVIRMIAHEVNNTVGGVTSALDTARSLLDGTDDGAELCDIMTMCIERSWSMSRFITKFADVVKIPTPQLQACRLNGLVASCSVFMETMCRNHKADFRCELCGEDPEVEIDRVLFEQVLVNIVKNAVESFGDRGGEVCVRTAPCEPMIEITDNGRPIPREVEARLFTPFFSTKPDGQGLGLLFVREVLDRHGCAFSLRTHDDGLTKFRISFGKRPVERNTDESV